MAGMQEEENDIHDHDDEAASDAEVDVAAMMGFGSFGSKPHHKKKRKLNEPGNAGTGANSVQLPVSQRTKNPVQSEPPLQHHLPMKPVGQASDSGVRATDNSHSDYGSGGGDQGSYTIDTAGSTRQEPGKLPNGEWDWYALRKGVLDENGDMAYFDKGFIEDPWAGLKPQAPKK